MCTLNIMKRPQKVVAYIIRDDRLVVLSHADDDSFNQSGLQVPAGTVREGELPEVAVLREAYEETGLMGLKIERYLGCAEFDMRPYVEQVHVRHFFHLSIGGDVPARWEAFEDGDGTHPPIRFELHWLPLKQAHVIAAGQTALLGRVFDDWGTL